MKTACIVTGGTVSEIFIKSYIKKHQPEILVAVDGALAVTHAAGMVPDYIVGDFDTVEPELLARYEEARILRHQPEKDQTDTELALETALECGCETVVLLGATGSRLDHSLANIFLLQSLLTKGIDAVILNENNKLYVKNSGFVIKKAEQFGAYVSLLPLTDKVEKVTLSGFKYSLQERDFYRESTLGISNEITEEEAKVSFTNGIFLVVEACDK